MKTTKTLKIDPVLAPLDPKIAAVVQDFAKFKVKHPRLAAAYKSTITALRQSAGPQVLIVTGPTGVGKSTLCKAVYNGMMTLYHSDMLEDPSYIPVVLRNSISPHSKNFSWKDFHYRYLKEDGEPLPDCRIDMPRQREIWPNLLKLQRLETSTVDAMRRSVEECIEHRRTRILLIDEAQLILMVKDPDMLEYQFEILKSLALITGATIVLFGTNQLLNIRDQCGQLVRRSEIIPLLRYDVTIKADRDAFASALQEFQDKLPIYPMPDLMKDLQYYYAKCAGCIGILQEWLVKALEIALTQDRPFTRELAEEKALTNKALRTIVQEAFICEEQVSDIGLEEIEQLLLKDRTAAPAWTVAKRSPRDLKVGQRKPTRDPVGGFHEARA